jgi:predicted small lipoprotein YifL
MAVVLRMIGLVVLLALTLVACGKKGALETPPPPPGQAPVQKGQGAPHKPFILDGLLR